MLVLTRNQVRELVPMPDAIELMKTAFAELSRTAPAIAIELLTGVGRELSARLRRANKTIDQLEK